MKTEERSPASLLKPAAFYGCKQAFKALVLTLLFVTGFTTESYATHFRYGNISSRVISGNTIEFKISQSYRRSFYGTPVVGSIVSTETFFFGDGGAATINLQISAINTTEDWMYGEAIITHTYAANGVYVAYYNNCCRLSTLQNNPDGNFYVWNRVCVNNSGNNSPVSTMPPILNMVGNNPAATFSVPVSDPDGHPLSFRMATIAETGGSGSLMPGISIHPNTGVITVNTVGKLPGQLYTASIVISDGCNEIINDFIVRIVNSSTPPFFDYTVTPANAANYQVAPGQTVAFNVKAQDIDVGDIVSLQGIGIPPGATLAPVLPANGNPVQTAFSWTPTLGQLGTRVITFVAQDLAGVQVTTSVTINVSLKPQFAVPPTPADASVTGAASGVPLSFTVEAFDVDPLDVVQITGATVPAGAILSDPTPTPAGNPTSTVVNWTPLISQWGPNLFSFTATDSYGETQSHSFTYVVNTQPVITTDPVLSVNACELYEYNISVDDPDLPYGDILDIVSFTTLPAWLTLTDNGDGTATLSGTPSNADAGSYSVSIHAEDIYHHMLGHNHNGHQDFTITVAPDNIPPAATCPQNITVGNDPGQCGAIVSYTVNSQDNCPGYSLMDASGSMDGGQLPTPAYTTQEFFPVGVTTKTFRVTDGNGLTSTCTFDVTVTDELLPYIECPANITVDNDPGQCAAVVGYSVIATDNCALQSLSCFCSDDNSPPGGFGSRFYQQIVPVGTTTNTFTATDVNGNSSTCSFDITVTDNEAPDAQCQDVTIQLDANGNARITAEQVDNGSTDNCGIRPQCPPGTNATCTDGLLLLRYLYGCNEVGENTATLTVTDINSNTSTCTATIFVEDNVAPDARCKNATVTLFNGVASLNESQVDDGSSDACGIMELRVTPFQFDCSDIGVHTATLRVEDINENVSTCTSTVTVLGAQPSCSIASVPTGTIFTGGNPKIIYLGYGAQTTRLVATATGGSTFTYSWTGPNLSSYTASNPIFSPTAAGNYTFTVTITNNFGCVTTCSISICVVDVLVPGSKGKKVYLCHVPPGNPANAHTLEVAINAVPAHLAHGDYLGRCGTVIPCNAPAPLMNSGTPVQSLQSSGTTTPADVLIGSSNTAAEKMVKEASVRVFPNPFSEQTTISFVSPVADKVKLVVMDPAGNEVSLLYDGPVDAFKDYQFIFNADRTMSSGIYFYRLQTGDGRSYVNKIILTK